MSERRIVAETRLATLAEEQLVTMSIDGQFFGVPILSVQDIVEPRNITPVPLAPSALAGVMNLRGRVVNVIDLRHCLGNIDFTPRDQQMGVTIEYRGDLYTLLVDEIGDVLAVAQQSIEKVPSTLDETLRRLCVGVVRRDEGLLIILDVERILDQENILATPPTTRRRQIAVEKADADEPSETDQSTEPAKPASNDKTLFDEIGGELSVHGAVHLLSDRLREDPDLAPLFPEDHIEAFKSGFVGFLSGRLGSDGGGAARDLGALLATIGAAGAPADMVMHHIRSAFEVMEMPPELVNSLMAEID